MLLAFALSLLQPVDTAYSQQEAAETKDQLLLMARSCTARNDRPVLIFHCMQVARIQTLLVQDGASLPAPCLVSLPCVPACAMAALALVQRQPPHLHHLAINVSAVHPTTMMFNLDTLARSPQLIAAALLLLLAAANKIASQCKACNSSACDDCLAFITTLSCVKMQTLLTDLCSPP
jgi:hypothetical protein